MLMFRFFFHRLGIVFTSAIFIISACTVGGKAKEDSTWSVETQQLESEAAAYASPQYTIGVVEFDNNSLATVSGVSEVTATLFKAQLGIAGLNAQSLDLTALKDEEKSKALQRAGAVKNGKPRPDSGLDTLDFRLSGSIASYSEVEEGPDAATQKKSMVARVTVDFALFEATTGKPLMAESAAGEFRKPTTGALVTAATPTFDPMLRDGALRNALAKATVALTRKLTSTPFQGKILAVDGTALVLKAGLRSQLKPGTQLAVYRVNRALIDPESGRVLGYKESKIGIIQFDSHLNENISTATVVSGSGFQAGDEVRLIP